MCIYYHFDLTCKFSYIEDIPSNFKLNNKMIMTVKDKLETDAVDLMKKNLPRYVISCLQNMIHFMLS